jgi:hypothetical protein
LSELQFCGDFVVALASGKARRLKSIWEEMQKAISGAIEAKILRVGLCDLIMHTSPDIVRIGAFDDLHSLTEDDRALVGTVFLKQA